MNLKISRILFFRSLNIFRREALIKIQLKLKIFDTNVNICKILDIEIRVFIRKLYKIKNRLLQIFIVKK